MDPLASRLHRSPACRKCGVSMPISDESEDYGNFWIIVCEQCDAVWAQCPFASCCEGNGDRGGACVDDCMFLKRSSENIVVLHHCSLGGWIEGPEAHQWIVDNEFENATNQREAILCSNSGMSDTSNTSNTSDTSDTSDPMVTIIR